MNFTSIHRSVLFELMFTQFFLYFHFDWLTSHLMCLDSDVCLCVCVCLCIFDDTMLSCGLALAKQKEAHLRCIHTCSPVLTHWKLIISRFAQAKKNRVKLILFCVILLDFLSVCFFGYVNVVIVIHNFFSSLAETFTLILYWWSKQQKRKKNENSFKIFACEFCNSFLFTMFNLNTDFSCLFRVTSISKENIKFASIANGHDVVHYLCFILVCISVLHHCHNKKPSTRNTTKYRRVNWRLTFLYFVNVSRWSSYSMYAVIFSQYLSCDVVAKKFGAAIITIALSKITCALWWYSLILNWLQIETLRIWFGDEKIHKSIRVNYNFSFYFQANYEKGEPCRGDATICVIRDGVIHYPESIWLVFTNHKHETPLIWTWLLA